MLFDKLLKAVDNERIADIAENEALLKSLTLKQLAANGLAVLNLSINNIRSVLGGKLELQLSCFPGTFKNLDSSYISVGDIVKIQNSNTDPDSMPITAVVSKVSSSSVSLILDRADDPAALTAVDNGAPLSIVKLANSTTYKRMEQTLTTLSKLPSQSHLQQVVLGTAPPIQLLDLKQVTPFNITINNSQLDAVKHSIQSELSVIHGPPGTGKTNTVVEVIRQLVLNHNESVLVCAPSNVAADTLLERINPHLPVSSIVRIGHPARVLDSVLCHSLDIATQSSDGGMLVKDIRNEIQQQLAKLKKARYSRERKSIYSELSILRKELRQREATVVQSVLKSAKVIVSTLHTSGSRALVNCKEIKIDTIIIDEVSQSLEPQCWIPLLNFPTAKRLVLAGDNKQLPPTLHIKEKSILAQTLFDRLAKLHKSILRMLLIQYRMNRTIMEFPSNEFYGGNLQADKSVALHLLRDLPGVQDDISTATPVRLIDTQGGYYNECEGLAWDTGLTNESKWNYGEAQLALEEVIKLVHLGVSPSDIGIIAPYSAQVQLLKKLFDEDERIDISGLEISTVDGFQGREKEVIVISMTRSNKESEVGFLSDSRRLNVSITRARRLLLVIGDHETLANGDKVFKNWTEWAANSDSSVVELEYPV
ncbi:hypothetical protein CANCADRAFT_84103 [Tortispora caseinolytica NRRL Y-17796]|uniref:DNA helicase n=1 Tax=Tortispora caseinolytica NRRL Y-17796 TaxID=767744 RepID=A0A1E4TKE7_9ASCO|nr:hypothetical protein CANCADRAFT_84103 [Tortispora caseinolytica NRRL Y-17796]